MAEENIVAANEAADDFDTAFSEFADARDGNTDSIDEDLPQDAPAAEPAEEKTDEPSSDKPATEVVATEKPEEKPVDWEHRYKSEVGRQTALQRQNAELKQRLTELEKQKAVPQAPQVSEQMQRMMQDFPEIAEAMQAEIDARLGAVKKEFEEALQPVKAEKQRRDEEREERTVLDVYPDYVGIVQDQKFKDWFSRQPSQVRSLANSDIAADAVALLDYYTGGNRPKTSPAGGDPKAQEIAARRQKSLERNVGIRNTAPTVAGDAPDDFETAFAHFAKKAEQRRVA